jgi:Cu/Ag efflux pump CusA
MAKEKSSEVSEKIELKNGYFQTPDGHKFNTRKKAEHHLQTIKTQ